MTALQRSPLNGQAAELLATRIAAGEWAIGAKLPTEAALAVELGVGRSTVREAIKELRGRGMVEARQGSGVYVIATEPPVEWQAVLRRADIDDVIEAREAIEVRAGQLAATRRDSKDLQHMRAALARRGPGEQSGSDEEFLDADIDFHRAVVRAAKNPVLSELFELFVPHVRTAMLDMLSLAGDDRHRHDQDAHAEIFAAIKARDPVRAAEATLRQLEADRAGNTAN